MSTGAINGRKRWGLSNHRKIKQEEHCWRADMPVFNIGGGLACQCSTLVACRRARLQHWLVLPLFNLCRRAARQCAQSGSCAFLRHWWRVACPSTPLLTCRTCGAYASGHLDPNTLSFLSIRCPRMYKHHLMLEAFSVRSGGT